MDSNLNGIEKVKQEKGKYAFFMEQGSIDYSVKENCDLMQVGKPLNARNYGLALKKGKAKLVHSTVSVSSNFVNFSVSRFSIWTSTKSSHPGAPGKWTTLSNPRKVVA